MTERIRRTLDFVRASFDACPRFQKNPADGAYRFEHTLRVARIGAALAKAEGFDQEAFIIACLLHDIAYSGTYPEGYDGRSHGRDGAKMARPFLETLGLAPHVVEDICFGIAIHVDGQADFPGERTAFALSVSDADNIDRFDVFRVYDTLRCTDFYPKPLAEKLAWTEKQLSGLEKLRAMDFATPTATALWREKLDYQRGFYTRLLQQLKNSTLPEEF